MAAKFRLIWENRYFDAATLTPSSEAAGFPAVNVQDKLRQRAWRTTGNAAESLIIDMGEAVTCKSLVLVNHNMTCAGKIAIWASNAADFSSLLLFQWETPCHPVVGYGEGGYGRFGYGGAIPEADRPYYDPEPIRVIYFSAPITARYWRLALYDPTNTVAYISLGRVFLCPYEEFSRQFGYGSAYGGLDESEMSRSLGGQLWIDAKPMVRVLNLQWSAFRREELNWPMLFFIRKVGTTEYFVIDPLPEGGASDRHVMKLYCRLAEIPEVTYLDHKFREVMMSFEEVI